MGKSGTDEAVPDVFAVGYLRCRLRFTNAATALRPRGTDETVPSVLRDARRGSASLQH